MPTITKELSWDMGHRLTRHESKCANVHGHRYRALLSVKAPALDAAGRVVDFSVLKEVVGYWVDAVWDHGFVANVSDPLLIPLRAADQKVYVLPCDPSAEVLSAWLFCKARKLLEGKPNGLTVAKVELWETPTSMASATPKTWMESLPEFMHHNLAHDVWMSQTMNDTRNVFHPLSAAAK